MASQATTTTSYNNNLTTTTARYFGTPSINVALSHRFPSSHYPRLPSFRALFLFPILLPTTYNVLVPIETWPHLQASLSPLKILAPEKPLLLSSEKLDHNDYPTRKESLKLNQF
jgi:hypothetical protein